MTPAARALTMVVLLLGEAGAALAGDAPPGATACTGCHPASRVVDSPVVRLGGLPATDIIAAVQAFRSGQRAATVMDRIAKGFSDDEISAIAAWYSAQRN